MIYADYARRKMHNVVKLGTAEGYPLVINNAKGKKLKDYTIEGNTEYGENLFNYIEPLTNSIKADENGWFDVSIDNSEETSKTKYVWCFTKISNQLKVNTPYCIFMEVAERTGDIGAYAVSTYSTDSSQFSKGVFLPSSGTRTTTVNTISDFSNSSNMLRTYCWSTAGKSGHIKFRIAVYETEKDVFLPYTKTSVGDMTKNLFNYTEPIKDSVQADENGWFDVTIDNTSGTSTLYRNCYTLRNDRLKPNTNYHMIVEVSERTGKINCNASSVSNDTPGQFASATLVTSNSVSTVIKTINNFDTCKNMLRTFCWCDGGKSGHIKFRIAVYETEKGYFEPYNKCKIPIVVSGENNATIYLNAPLADGESINYKADNLPDIVLNKGTNTITTGTAVKPKKLITKYYKK